MEELAFLHEVVCLHLPLALQVDEGGVDLVNGVAMWLLLHSSMSRLLLPCRGWWIFPALAAAPSKLENSMVDELAQVYGVFAWRGKCARGF